jgi:Txe/YoeB family toxin of toxin-antitoxin system
LLSEIYYYDQQAAKDAKNLKAALLDGKAKALIEILRKNPLEPPYEELVGNLSGLYSRRINIKHRLVYEIINKAITDGGIEYEGAVKIIRLWTHYENVK